MTTSLSSLFRALGMLVPISLLAMGAMVRATTLPSTAFFYGSAMPAASLSKFDRIVVEAANVQDLSALRARGAQVFAYVSVGEAEGWRDSTRALPPGLFMGANPDWQSRVADLTQPGWKKFLLEDRMASLWAQGYRAFFLDTLDSYQRYATTPAAQAVQTRALVDIIRSMHQRFPGVELLFNRGFEVLPEVAPLSVGIVAESLFQSWNPALQEYVAVSPPDREWLQRAQARQHTLPAYQSLAVALNRKDLSAISLLLQECGDELGSADLGSAPCAACSATRRPWPWPNRPCCKSPLTPTMSFANDLSETL